MFNKRLVQLTSIRTIAVYISYSDVKKSRSVSQCYDIERYRTIVGLVEIYVHVLACVVAAKRGYYRITCLAADNKAIIFAYARPRSIKVKFQKVQSDLANIWLPCHSDLASSRISEGTGRTRRPEIGTILCNCFAATFLDLIKNIYNC